MKKITFLFVITLLSISLKTNKSLAAAFATDSHSTSVIGTSFAGQATGAHDISDSFSNAANLSDIDKSQLVLSTIFLDINIDEDNTSAQYSNSNPVSGSRNDDAGEDALIPAFYFATPINDKTTFGLGVTMPFALATKYDEEWVGRYHAVESSIQTININPQIAYELLEDKLSVGFGFQAQYMKAVLTKIADFGVFTMNPGTNDQFAKAKGDDWGYGFTLGTKYKINDKLEAGIGYRSKIKHKLNGDIKAGTYESEIDAPITTPEILDMGLKYQLTDNAEILSDVIWTRWSRINSLDIIAYSNSSILSESQLMDLQDAWKYALGLNFKANNKWLLRLGTSYETSAVDKYRRPSIPSGNKLSIGTGFSYKLNENSNIDFAYMHQFLSKVQSDLESTSKTSSLETNYKTSVDIFALGFKYEF